MFSVDEAGFKTIELSQAPADLMAFLREPKGLSATDPTPVEILTVPKASR